MNLSFRHAFRRVLPSLGLLALLLVLTAPSAEATLTWCRADPIVDIGGKRAHIWVSGVEGIQESVTGPTKVKIFVPKGVDRELIETDEGFGMGYDVRFVADDDLRVNGRGIQIRVEVYVPANDDIPVRVEITDRQDELLERTTGATNEWLVGRAWL